MEKPERRPEGLPWEQASPHPPERTAFRPFPRTDLLLKEIRMGAGTDQVQFVSFGAVNQKPVRLEMGLPIALPKSPEWMIEIAGG